MERRLLQIFVTLATLVPILGGGWGVLGPGVTATGTEFADSHHRYLSGLLLAIGVAFLLSVPRIEQHTARFRLLAALVVTGGLARLFALAMHRRPTGEIIFALIMELGVTPALALWQWRVARSRPPDA